MADCVLVEELSSVCVNDLLNENDVILGSVSDDSNNTLDSIKSGYFVLSESEKCCSNFDINGAKIASCPELDSRVMGSDSEEFMASLKSISEENGHNCRKKRCADRYDSSESSDSGIATLSCTDCSSGSSSGTSDITEPGSPFSISSHSESDPESCGSPGKMPPTHWQPHSPRYTHYLTHSHIATKKHKSDNNNCCKQGKITEYFKSKSNCHNRDKLALHFSNTAAKLSLVFQKNGPQVIEDDKITQLDRIPAPLRQHRKSFDWNDESAVQVTSVFSKPRSSSKPCASKGSVSTKRKTPSSEDSAHKSTCSTPTDSNPSSPLSISTIEQCSEKPSLPSPILRTPSIIRFPVHNGWKNHYLSDTVCRWSDCEEAFSSTSALLEHLQTKHVNTQSLCETFVCLWNGCKVYDKSSCSRSWLERHVLSHGGNKPFRCIVDGCGQRFSSQTMLERHVNQHFNEADNSSSSGPSGKKSLESTPNKLFRRNGKKLRYRRQPFSARMFDYMDTGIMEGVQHALLEVTRQQTADLQQEATNTNFITLHSKVIGRRESEDGTNILLRWFPPNILRDEWARESELALHRSRRVDRTKHQDSDALCTAPLFHRRPGHNQRKWRKTATSTR